MQFKNIILSSLLVLPLYADDVVVERMQSVVNEVTELRERYEDARSNHEACLLQLQDQNKELSSETSAPLVDDKRIKELEEENEKLKEVHVAAKKQAKRIKELESEAEVLLKEKNRLNVSAQILVEKNHSLLQQLNKLKRSSDGTSDPKLLIAIQEKEKIQRELVKSRKRVLELEENSTRLKSATTSSISVATASTSALEKENMSLRQSLERCQDTKPKVRVKVKSSKGVCVDENPFPKLLKKETKTKASTKRSSGVYRIKGESSVYDATNGKVIEIWEDTRSFTSNVSQGEWVKITGFFVDKKWRKAKRDMWVEKENTLRR